MTYPEWTDAVNQALKASGNPFTVLQIDPALLSAAFHSGQSPVLFARSAVAMPPQNAPLPPQPSASAALLPSKINGWLSSIAVVFFVFAAYQFADASFVLVGVSASRSEASGILWRSVIMPTYTSSAALCFSGMVLLAFERIIVLLNRIAAISFSGQP